MRSHNTGPPDLSPRSQCPPFPEFGCSHHKMPPVTPPSTAPRPRGPDGGPPLPDHRPGWSIQEDWALLHAVTSIQNLPLSLASASPARIPNWDLAADMVNNVSTCYRAAEQCRARYEDTLVSREGGCDVTPDKIKKMAKLGLTRSEKKVLTPTPKQGMKTGALFKADNNKTFSTMYSGRLEMIQSLANRRATITKPVTKPITKPVNPKLPAVLYEYGINYDSPLNPVEVAANQAERIGQKKLREAQMAARAAAVTAGFGQLGQLGQPAGG